MLPHTNSRQKSCKFCLMMFENEMVLYWQKRPQTIKISVSHCCLHCLLFPCLGNFLLICQKCLNFFAEFLWNLNQNMNKRHHFLTFSKVRILVGGPWSAGLTIIMWNICVLASSIALIPDICYVSATRRSVSCGEGLTEVAPAVLWAWPGLNLVGAVLLNAKFASYTYSIAFLKTWTEVQTRLSVCMFVCVMYRVE